MIDEKKLLKKLAERDVGAIEKVIKIYTPYLTTVLYNVAGTRLSREDLEEIISDVFITVWKNAEYINLEKGTIRSYMGAIARNLALRRMKGTILYTPIEDLSIADTSDEIESYLSADMLWDAVMALGEPDAEIFVRHYKYDERLKTIAGNMGMNISTVKTRLSRGKKRLKELLKEESF